MPSPHSAWRFSNGHPSPSLPGPWQHRSDYQSLRLSIRRAGCGRVGARSGNIRGVGLIGRAGWVIARIRVERLSRVGCSRHLEPREIARPRILAVRGILFQRDSTSPVRSGITCLMKSPFRPATCAVRPRTRHVSRWIIVKRDPGQPQTPGQSVREVSIRRISRPA